ncbi:gluconokinase [Leucobacter musarum]|uniref:gluconokinase n=1 Tax=Leucobacter musarum TaxID=1930747 RepID=UPI0009E9BF2B|nr:gluconokinase [Leucobacter musarum]
MSDPQSVGRALTGAAAVPELPEATSPARGLAVVVMGVAGCGKTTVAAALAERVGGSFIEADALHTPAAVAQMRAGVPLTDVDRAPWLDRVAERMRDTAAIGYGPVFTACSALRRSYRDQLRAGIGPGCAVVFVHLEVTRSELAARISARPDHFMPVALLDSQLATLEPLGADEPGLTIDGALPESRLLDPIAAQVQRWRSAGGVFGAN